MLHLSILPLFISSPVMNMPYRSDFQLGFRRTQGFRERLPRVPQLDSDK